MKRKVLLLGCLVSTLTLAAQEKNKRKLDQNFEKQKIENDLQFEKYWNNLDNLHTTHKNKSEKEQLKNSVAFFFEGKPYYLSTDDTHQNISANIDFLHDGTISGLTGAFTGNGLQLHQFDGGRIYNYHPDLGGTAPATTPTATPGVESTRITNGESNSVGYSDHATNVASMMASAGRSLSYTNGTPAGNTKGVAPHAQVVGYSFRASILPGVSTSPLSVFQKILEIEPHISNHSYGVNSGWRYASASSNNLGAGWYWGGGYDTDTNTSYDLMGTYFNNDFNYDLLVSYIPSMIIVKSAGNYFGDGPTGSQVTNAYFGSGTSTDPYQAFDSSHTLPLNNCSNGYDCIGPGSLAKNIIVVGSTMKITANNGRYTDASDVVRSGFSSAGPRDDGGIKPDIAGVGSDILSATYNPQTNGPAYTQGSGTSYSAPNVTAIIGLWNTIYSSLFSNQNLNAAKAKTLLLHSAQEAGNHPGPDAWFGWGFADAKKGAELLVGKSNGNVIFEEQALNNDGTYTLNITPTSNGPLKVTISWVDPEFQLPPSSSLTIADVYNNRASRLVNDLDLRVIHTATNEASLPWRLNINNLDAGAERGDNTVDNVEQVVIDNAIAGATYKILVTHKGTLKNNEAQNFAIIAEGTNGITQLSTDELVKKKDALIYPTIVKDVLNIQLPSTAPAKVSIYDTSGKLIKRQDVKGNTSIQVNELKQGVYLISIDSNDIKTSKKFIKE